jgi:hypothetical protein
MTDPDDDAKLRWEMARIKATELYRHIHTLNEDDDTKGTLFCDQLIDYLADLGLVNYFDASDRAIINAAEAVRQITTSRTMMPSLNAAISTGVGRLSGSAVTRCG